MACFTLLGKEVSVFNCSQLTNPISFAMTDQPASTAEPGDLTQNKGQKQNKSRRNIRGLMQLVGRRIVWVRVRAVNLRG